MFKKIIFIVSLLFTIVLKGQDTLVVKKNTKEDSPLKFYLSEDKSHFFQVTFLNQTWLRYTQLNPGSSVLGDASKDAFDIGLRRTRIQMFGQVTDRAFLYFQFGMNNFNRMTNVGGNRKAVTFFHDALGEYKITNGNQLKVGGGLTIANGLSRFTQPSIGTMLALDVPVFAQATVDQTDNFDRKLSLYARGQIGKFDYRFVFSDPFPVTSSGNSLPAISTTNAFFAQKGHTKQYQSYLMYQFFDKEAHTTPYMTGCYLGKKKVLNVAGGIIYQDKAMWLQNAVTGDTIYQKMVLWSAEVFMDMPFNKEKGTALTAYAGYFNNDYGTNYIRRGQQMNPGDPNVIAGAPTHNYINGGGNGFPMMGTGQVIFAQLGYLFKKNLLGESGTLQPYATWQYNDYKFLKIPANIYDIGLNWLMNGHKSKLSVDYQSRPVYDLTQKPFTRKGTIIMQYQIFI